ncbi:MAG TPA: hypothetical protein PKJ85_12255, partial [Nitrosomonas nitrosa]|nr:hypothetical protein [Nitrosomonas nitrosa]
MIEPCAGHHCVCARTFSNGDFCQNKLQHTPSRVTAAYLIDPIRLCRNIFRLANPIYGIER